MPFHTGGQVGCSQQAPRPAELGWPAPPHPLLRGARLPATQEPAGLAGGPRQRPGSGSMAAGGPSQPLHAHTA